MFKRPELLLVALLAAAALPAGAVRPKLDEDPRALVPAAPDACTPQIRKGTAWGVATAAYQIEGAWNVSGRTPSVWDVYAHIPGKIKDGDTGDVACDHYHRYKEDFKLMKEMGVKHYRFSISWNRVLPGGGRGSAVNPAGVDFYNRLLDEMQANGITPAATMFHWDLPQSLHERYLGPLGDSEFVEDFANYADVLFKSFPRIKQWMTFNEPLITCDASYGVGKFAPGYKGGIPGIYKCAHNVLLSHGRVKQLSRTKYAHLDHKIGIALNVEWAEPMSNTTWDREAAQRSVDIQFGVYADPLFLGRYPELLKKKFGPSVMKDFTPEEADMVRGSADFLGINHYTSRFVRANEQPLGFVVSVFGRDSQPIGPVAQSSWLRVVPDGLYKITQYASKRYGNPEIWITENGVSAPNEAEMPVDHAVRDAFRTKYYSDYLDALCRSKRDGARITKYLAWSFMDNFEWLQGYSERFGVVHVDFKSGSLKRAVKDSGRFLSKHFFSVGAADAPADGAQKKPSGGKQSDAKQPEAKRPRGGGGSEDRRRGKDSE
ncbi:glycoside hydrolase family 1 [Raphidocelis subcapitata]|uniref:Glycoside hydrolase family 1 n=1 Tax=Raphidocelis subcapitata TaxID=307507 RepID=A0A2V0NSJ3_9CHLO|nr:glycoside hydrolase family 1 [Raphidocelis subcapitata]|eukprot:GBF87897.1 glycoside hydrolase family 1 [Raphidocelis subcapitata]